MTQFLPPNLLALFAPRDPIPFKPPVGQLPWEKDRDRAPYTGVGQLTRLFEDPKDTPAPTRGETKDEKAKRRIKEKAVLRAKELEKEIKNWDPHGSKNATGDAFKTLFVGRINYDTSESKLRREFETYGPIRKIRMVHDEKTGKPRGYAFIEFEHERDMHTAYKSADGKKIDKRRVIVDVERGRTVKGWRPRRLGGGMGGTRRAVKEEVRKEREPAAATSTSTTRERSRERDRSQRNRSRSREKDRRRRSRSRDRKDRDRKRDKERGDRESYRDRDRRREKSRGEKSTDTNDEGRSKDKDRDRKHRHRDRSHERDSKRDRKRSRERDRGDRDKERRSDRDKDSSRKTEESNSNGLDKNAEVKMETDDSPNQVEDISNQETNYNGDSVVKKEEPGSINEQLQELNEV